MITNFELHDFKGHRDTRLTLGRFTALVGDNASGKTSVLEALELLGVNDGAIVLSYGLSDLVRRSCARSRLVATGEQQGQHTRDELEIEIESAGLSVKFAAKRTGSRGEVGFAASANGVPVLLSRTDTENTVIALEGIFDHTRFHGDRKLDRMAELLEGSGLFEALA